MKTSNGLLNDEPFTSVCYLGTPRPGVSEFRFTMKSGEVRTERLGDYEAGAILHRATVCPKAKSEPTRTERPNSLPEDDAKRAQYPMADGLIDYFPNALAEVSRVSYIGSLKHNKGQPMHWARAKSTDHRNKIARHLVDAGGVDVVMVDGKEERVRHSAYLAWRALANLQTELEEEEGYPPSRASKFPQE